MEKIKLFQNYDNGTTHNKKCPIFMGAEDIEGLLYVNERFRGIAWQLKFDTGPELFDNFKEVITDATEDKWDGIVGGILPKNGDLANFDESIKKFYLKYCDKQARDTMLEYLSGLRHPTK
eukprot:3402383-Ditylum_brightwellii.AAC.1